MDPNNNQSTPVPTPAPVSTPIASSKPMPETPKSGGKGIILLIIILVLVIGMAAYILFAKNQLNYIQKTSTNSTSVILPSPTLAAVASPTPGSVAELNVVSPENDLQSVENDLQTL